MTILVTGGGGFLGGAIVDILLARGEDVRSIARSDYPELRQRGVDVRRGDLSNPSAVADAVEGCDAVIHVAAKAGVWGSFESYYSANYLGTLNVIDACRAHGVSKLVYTSTPSVVHGGEHLEGIDESAKYPRKFETHYPHTKAMAEKAVLESNDESLSTVALRPHLIWGPGDNHLVPRIVDRARRGRLAFVGDGENIIDGTFIDNAARAHVLALDALEFGSACAGKAYFITNDEPMATSALINGIVQAADLPPVTRKVPPQIAYAVGAMLETVYGLLGKEDEPPMTRFVAKQLSTAHWYDISAAKRDLGYNPEVSTEEGLRRLSAWLRSNDV